jgi:hypothetical protein
LVLDPLSAGTSSDSNTISINRLKPVFYPALIIHLGDRNTFLIPA